MMGPAKLQFIVATAIILSLSQNGLSQGPLKSNLAESANFVFDVNNDLSILVLADTIRNYMFERHTLIGSDPSRVAFLESYLFFGFADSLVPYHETATGFITRIKRRPDKERTPKNRITCLIYMLYQFASGMGKFNQESENPFIPIMEKLGPDALSKVNVTDTSTPIGIGNTVGKAVVRAAWSSLINFNGNLTGDFNQEPYFDYTGYVPVNSAGRLKNPYRWQPALVPGQTIGKYYQQVFATPQMGMVKPLFLSSVDQYVAKPHGRHFRYTVDTNEVIDAQSSITEEQKVAAEYFDNLLNVHVNIASHFAIRVDTKFSLLESVFKELGLYVSAHDAFIPIWREKRKHNAVRPFSAVAFTRRDSPLRGYTGAPNYEIKNGVRGNRWRSFLPVNDCPEYPSAHSAFCAAQAVIYSSWYGTDDMYGFEITIKKGQSIFEPGVGPSRDITIKFDNWTQYQEMCANSRIWGGVSFRDSVDEGLRLGSEIAKEVYKRLIANFNPTK